MNKFEKAAKLMVLLMAAVLLIAGCSKKDKETAESDTKREATLTIDEQKQIVITYTETFDKTYYSKEELEAKVTEELAGFNREHSSEGNAAMESLEVADGKAVLKIRFSDGKAYTDYVNSYVKPEQEAKLFVGTYSEAASNGYKFSGKYISGTDLSELTEDDFEETDKLMVVYTNEEQKILVSGDIKYYGDTVTLEKGLAVTADGKENYIIYKPEEK